MPEPADAEMVQVLELRAALLSAIRRFFADRDFIEVETPAIVPSPGLDVHLSAFEVRDPNGKRIGWLATSPEYQMKRLLSAGAKRIFQSVEATVARNEAAITNASSRCSSGIARTRHPTT